MFFKDITDVKKYISVDASFKFSEMSIFLTDVDRAELKKYLGKDFLSDLNATFAAASTFESLAAGNVKDLIELLRVASARLALSRWVTTGQVGIDQSGIYISSTDTRKTAFQWQIRDIQRELAEGAFLALDDALELLEDNISASEFSVYKSSDAFKENASLFVSTCKEFSKYFSSIAITPTGFLRMRSIISKVEDFYIKPVLLNDTFSDIKSKLQNGDALSSEYNNLLNIIKPAVVNLTMSRAVRELAASFGPRGFTVFDNTATRDTSNMEKQASELEIQMVGTASEKDGAIYLGALKSYMDAHASSYPLYTADPSYMDPATVKDLNEPDELDRNNFFVGG